MRVLSWLSFATLLLALSVILLGAYTRLKDAGLGCPDWPGCYGQLLAPSTHEEITAANAAFPGNPVDVGKAQTEMTHRYFAQALGSFILIFAMLAYWKRKVLKLPLWLPGLLVGLVLFQGLLGMWTVTFRLLPIVVVSHLLGGFCTLALLWLCWLYLRYTPLQNAPAALLPLTRLTLIVLLAQIILGGLTSANYAALICGGFPLCQNQWWPTHGEIKTTIHLMHRLGALLTLSLGAVLSFYLWQSHLRKLSMVLGTLLLIQICLGISNVIFYLPLPVAVAHNGIGALLLLTLVTIHFILPKKQSILSDYWALCKPRVVALMIITAWVGMLLASPADSFPLNAFCFGSLGIALCAASAASINHLVERHIDIHMRRTQHRPIATGRIQPKQAFIFSLFLGALGLSLLHFFVNDVTAWLTLASLLGYALFYTLYLKRATPQNIVIGGVAGAAPPLLGWSAVSGDISPFGILLMLIVFTWTPPHFWALAIYRCEDYAKAKLPMLPVTHGIPFTKLCILFYIILLIATTLLPFLTGMSGVIYLFCALGLGLGFLYYGLKLYFSDNPLVALHTFTYSIIYLFALFLAFLLDHYF